MIVDVMPEWKAKFLALYEKIKSVTVNPFCERLDVEQPS
jgi:hypothetical protein